MIVPPVGYLQRLREICTANGILLIFDEVITGFGRMGENFGAQRFGVTPDIITFAKAVTNGIVPMGGVIVTDEIYNTFMTGPENAIEFCHGYTYSGHPMAAAVGHVVLDVMREEGLVARVRELEPVLEDAIHSLKDLDTIADIRNIGLTAAIDLKPVDGKPGARGQALFEAALRGGLLLRVTGRRSPSGRRSFPPRRNCVTWFRHFASSSFRSAEPRRSDRNKENIMPLLHFHVVKDSGTRRNCAGCSTLRMTPCWKRSRCLHVIAISWYPNTNPPIW